MCYPAARRSVPFSHRGSAALLGALALALTHLIFASAPAHARVWLETAPVAARAELASSPSTPVRASNASGATEERARPAGVCLGSYWPVGPLDCGRAAEQGARRGRSAAGEEGEGWLSLLSVRHPTRLPPAPAPGLSFGTP
ncbi:MAG: hypothetical protein IPL40_13010 [Proteobacteria bacterium]|nr:hypothetical protein [Pseudomonadota bacterium]